MPIVPTPGWYQTCCPSSFTAIRNSFRTFDRLPVTWLPVPSQQMTMLRPASAGVSVTAVAFALRDMAPGRASARLEQRLAALVVMREEGEAGQPFDLGDRLDVERQVDGRSDHRVG